MTKKLALAALAAAAFLCACATTQSSRQCSDENGVHQRMTSTGECTHDAADFTHGG